MKGYTAITGWVADVSAAVLADLYLRAGAIPAGPPSKTTIWRVLTDADPELLDAAVGAWLMNLAGLATPAGGVPDRAPGRGALMQVRLDGKAIRGTKDADGNQVRLLAALVGPDAAGRAGQVCGIPDERRLRATAHDATILTTHRGGLLCQQGSATSPSTATTC